MRSLDFIEFDSKFYLKFEGRSLSKVNPNWMMFSRNPLQCSDYTERKENYHKLIL